MIDPDRLVKALQAVDQHIVDEHPETAAELFSADVEKGRRDFAEAIIAEYYFEHPDDPHVYDLRCTICGRPGTVRVSIDESK